MQESSNLGTQDWRQDLSSRTQSNVIPKNIISKLEWPIRNPHGGASTKWNNTNALIMIEMVPSANTQQNRQCNNSLSLGIIYHIANKITSNNYSPRFILIRILCYCNYPLLDSSRIFLENISCLLVACR